jgi:hypothetical protein
VDDYRAIEGVLYSLRRSPDAKPSSPGVGWRRHSFGPRDPVDRLAPRLDIALATQRLEAADRSVLVEHYVRGNAQPGRLRRQAIRRLRLVLAEGG